MFPYTVLDSFIEQHEMRKREKTLTFCKTQIFVFIIHSSAANE